MKFSKGLLICDRTQADVDYAMAEVARVKQGGEITEDYLRGLKGSYNVADLNRVETATKLLAEVLQGYAYISGLETKTDHTSRGFFYPDNARRYLDNVNKLRTAFCALATTPPVPDNYNQFEKANAIEQNLVDIDFLIDCMVQEFTEHRKCGDFVCGDYDFLPNVETIFIMRGFNKSRKTAAELGAIGATWAEIREGAWQ